MRAGRGLEDQKNPPARIRAVRADRPAPALVDHVASVPAWGLWRAEHRPVLRAVVDLYDETGDVVRDDAVSDRSHLPLDRVRVALGALDAAGYFTSPAPGGSGIEVATTAGGTWYVGAPTAAAREALRPWWQGAWPNRSRAALIVSVVSLVVAVVSVIVSVVTA